MVRIGPGLDLSLALALAAVLAVGAALAARRLAPGSPVPSIPIMIAAEMALAFWAHFTGARNGMLGLSLLLAAALLTLAVVDMAALRLPDAITLPLIAIGLAVDPGRVGLWDRLVGAAVGWAAIAILAWVFRRLRARDGIGLGDAKLLAAAGAWLGGRALPWTLVLACALAFAWLGARGLRQGRLSLGHPLPFGAPLALAIWVVWLYGPPFG